MSEQGVFWYAPNSSPPSPLPHPVHDQRLRMLTCRWELAQVVPVGERVVVQDSRGVAVLSNTRSLKHLSLVATLMSVPVAIIEGYGSLNKIIHQNTRK
jgi:hypothetical protein